MQACGSVSALSFQQQNRCHGDVGQDVAFKTQGTASPSDLNQPVVALVHRQFAAPILLEHHASDQGQGRGDGTGVKFAVDCREHQAPVIEADEFQRHFTRRQIDADARTGLHFGDGDVEQQFTVRSSTPEAAQHGSVGDGAHLHRARPQTERMHNRRSWLNRGQGGQSDWSLRLPSGRLDETLQPEVEVAASV